MRCPSPLLRVLPVLLLTTLVAAAPGQTQWKLDPFTWVKRTPAEAGAPANAQPAALSPAALQAALGPVRVTVDGKEEALFAADELQGLAKILGEAFAAIQPGEDLLLLSTHKRGGGFLDLPLGLTARLFVREGALHLLVQEPRLVFMDRYTVDRTVPTFVYGSRAKASGATLQAPGATRLRPDWLALPLVAMSAPAATPVAATAPMVPKAAPAPVLAAPSPATRDAAFYEAQTQRLKALKKLREENLLSEPEYQEKRDAILKTL